MKNFIKIEEVLKTVFKKFLKSVEKSFIKVAKVLKNVF